MLYPPYVNTADIITFPLMFDVILYIEVNGHIGSNAGGPALSDVGLGNFYDGKCSDDLCHPGPASKHYSSIFWLPVWKEREDKSVRRSELLTRLKSVGFRAAHGTTADLFTFVATTTEFLYQLT